MNIRYDESVDAIYIQIKDSKILDSEEVSLGIVCDFDSSNDLVGIEVLGVKDKTIEQLREIGVKFDERERAILRDVFGKFAAAM
jgi:uncharacterized protein YuzE